jgi:AraC-like DNA-binding protein
MHKYWELTYVDSGCLTTEVNDETYIIKSNELMVYAPGSFARQSTDNKTCSYLTIIFAMDLLKPEEEVLLSDRVFTADPEIRKAIDVFVRSNKSAHYEDLMLNSIDLIVTHLLRYNQDQPARIIPTPMQQKFESELLNEILVYVNENIYNSFNVEELCNHFAISRSSLQALFKNNLGVAPKQFISDMKLKKSRLLIKESKYTISEISNMLGYSSIHYFSRKFKSEYGMTPTEYAHKLID